MPDLAPSPSAFSSAQLSEVAATGRQPRGWEPATVPAGWLPALRAAGVPFAADGLPWQATIDPELSMPRRSADGHLLLPPATTFVHLTSLALKPLRAWVDEYFSVRLQLGVGVELHLWANQLVLANASGRYRGGFMHGPLRGMRTVVALEPGSVQRIEWQ